MHFKTRAIHAGQAPDPHYGAVMTPIYQTSTFAFQDVNHPGTFDYSRSGNPTRQALEECLASLEGGTHGFAFATGMAAVATVLELFKQGDHLIVHDDIYGGTYRYLVSISQAHGVTFDFINLRDIPALRAAIKSNTRGIWTETPTNPLMNLLDLEAISAVAKEKGCLTICDNTFSSPYFQKPLDLGIDIVMHSMTKYINGHSDVVAGALIVRNAEIAEQLKFYQNAMGTCLGPFDSFLVLRGIKTLGLRMEEHQRNALALAAWLEDHPKIERVLHPGLPGHPQHALSQRQMSGHGGTFSFRVRGGEEEAFRLLRSVRVFTLAPSLGGVESLIGYPWTMSHDSMDEAVRIAVGITRNLIRVSVGLEHIDDLIADLQQALAHV